MVMKYSNLTLETVRAAMTGAQMAPGAGPSPVRIATQSAPSGAAPLNEDSFLVTASGETALIQALPEEVEVAEFPGET
jgi:hypothetical protein